MMKHEVWLNKKGLGKGVSPKTIDMVARDRMILSLLTTNKISLAYDDIKKGCEDEEVTQKEAACVIPKLCTYSKTPDEINTENLIEEIGSLKSELAKMQKERCDVTEQQQKREEEYENRVKKLEEQYYESKKENDALREKIQEFLENQARKKLRTKRIVKGSIFSLGLIIVIIGFCCACRLLFKIDNSLSGLISIILAIVLPLPMSIRTLWKKFVIGDNRC